MKLYRLASLLILFTLLVSACTPAATATQPPAPTDTAAVVQPQATAAPAGPTATAALAKPTSTELNLYGWSDYVPQQLLDDFTSQYGIKVNYDTYSSNEEMLAKLQAGASGYDLVIPSDYTVTIMVKQGMLEPLDQTKIPNYANLDTRCTNKEYDPGNKY